MILDRYNEFSDAQDITGSTGDIASTNVVDLNAEGDAYGHEMYLIIGVDTTCASSGGATVTPRLETSDDSSFSSATTLWTGEQKAYTDLTAGTEVAALRVPSGCERYLRVVYAIGTAALTAGKMNAFLTPAPQANDFS
jgi:hypothetical protein